jgi:hypothetical protein
MRKNKTEYAADVICENGHSWSPVRRHLLKGHWCNVCATPGIREIICKKIIEHLTGEPFIKKRHEWLRNDRGNMMELDGYCEELKLAFECNGEQHYMFIPAWHGTEANLNQRQADDKRKEELCNDQKITLLTIKYDKPLDELQEYVAELLHSSRPDIKLSETKYNYLRTKTGRILELEELKRIAESRGGKCLSDQYINQRTKLNFMCDKGHRWSAVPSSIKHNGTWCSDSECKGDRIAQARAPDHSIALGLIKKNHGELLAIRRGTPIESRLRGQFKYLVRCRQRHEFLTTAPRLREGHWCRKCSSKRAGRRLKLTLADVRKTANDRGGRLISKHYIRARVNMLWECGAGHRWLACANSVRRGSWCPVCNGKKVYLFSGSVREYLKQEALMAKQEELTY